MDIVKIEKKQTLSREEAAHQLRAIADELASGNGILMERDGLRVTVTLPDEVTMEVEVEIEHDEREFEITLSW
ncbi:amphi-Trp domain-containing protein [Microcella sp.]|jgi:amphi-Trp domain-containing protein|uniref:amphi-Trp domain-containing protein n=1 Tax=Microcella sp. TaxID=1913979 RepID=UPI003918E274